MRYLLLLWGLLGASGWALFAQAGSDVLIRHRSGPICKSLPVDAHPLALGGEHPEHIVHQFLTVGADEHLRDQAGGELLRTNTIGLGGDCRLFMAFPCEFDSDRFPFLRYPSAPNQGEASCVNFASNSYAQRIVAS